MKKDQKKKGSKFEKKVAQTIGSGNLWFNQGDLQYGNYLVECKMTDQKGFRIPLEMVEKLWVQALSMNKEPLLTIGIKRNDQELFILNCQVQLQRR